jgi:hypothetical protein
MISWGVYGIIDRPISMSAPPTFGSCSRSAPRIRRGPKTRHVRPQGGPSGGGDSRGVMRARRASRPARAAPGPDARRRCSTPRLALQALQARQLSCTRHHHWRRWAVSDRTGWRGWRADRRGAGPGWKWLCSVRMLLGNVPVQDHRHLPANNPTIQPPNHPPSSHSPSNHSPSSLLPPPHPALLPGRIRDESLGAPPRRSESRRFTPPRFPKRACRPQWCEAAGDIIMYKTMAFSPPSRCGHDSVLPPHADSSHPARTHSWPS